MSHTNFWDEHARALASRKEKGLYRELFQFSGPDFISNDYLGFARIPEIAAAATHILQRQPIQGGATGSRLVSGNQPLFEETESFLADWYNARSALLFNSGFDANLALLSSLPQKQDTILYDAYAHASMREGIRLSKAQAYHFSHNDMEDLERLAARAKGKIYIVTEGIFSMHGDQANLEGIIRIAEKYQAYILVDEAHSAGILNDGQGLCKLYANYPQLIRIVTFGKAWGGHGAVVLGVPVVRDFLINFAKPFIYSTAFSLHSVAWVQAAHQYFNEHPEILYNFQQVVGLYCSQKNTGIQNSPIQVISLPDEASGREIVSRAAGRDICLKCMLPPTVPVGQERLRITLHAFNTREEIREMLTCLPEN